MNEKNNLENDLDPEVIKVRDKIITKIGDKPLEEVNSIIKKLLKDIKNEKGCHFSRLTGTGSVCYGLFRDQIFAKKALYKLKNKYPKFWFSLAKTV